MLTIYRYHIKIIILEKEVYKYMNTARCTVRYGRMGLLIQIPCCNIIRTGFY